jgi:hypothetical protein
MYKHLLSLSFLVAILLLVGAACVPDSASLTFITYTVDQNGNQIAQPVEIDLTQGTTTQIGRTEDTTITTTQSGVMVAETVATHTFTRLQPNTAFSFTVPPSSGFQIAPDSPTPPAMTGANGTNEPVPVKLQPLATVTVNITSGDNKTPLTGVSVSLTLTSLPAGFDQPTNPSVSLSSDSLTGTARISNLPPNAPFNFDVSAPGFTDGTPTTNPSAPTSTGGPGSNTTVNVQLIPIPQQQTVTVEFQTTANPPSGVIPSAAQITITPGNFGTITTLNIPGQGYASADVNGFTVGTAYTYSAFFTQFGQTVTSTRPFTPMITAGGGPFIVPIQLIPGVTTAAPMKALPPPSP